MAKVTGSCENCMYFFRDKNDGKIFCHKQQIRLDEEINECKDFKSNELLVIKKHYLNGNQTIEDFQIPVRLVETKKRKKSIKK